MITHQFTVVMSNTILVTGLLSGFTLGCSACRRWAWRKCKEGTL